MNVIGLLQAYGFEIEFVRKEEHKTRLRGNGTFIDIWNSKKGITAGIYNPKTASMSFHKNLTDERLEDLIIPIHREYGEN